MSTKWMKELERNVLAASEELRLLRKGNRVLKSKVQRLEKKVSTLKKSSSDGQESPGPDMALLRRRVDRLVDKLEQMRDL